MSFTGERRLRRAASQRVDLRAGTMRSTLATHHGTLQLPAFLPDATKAVVRTLDADDLRQCGVQGLVVNTFHLSNHPGADVVSSVGGLHSFMNWSGPILADSGGFQVFSLSEHSRKRVSVTRKGFHYRLQRGDDAKTLTPQSSIRKQFRMGADILVCLDHCTHPDAPQNEQRTSVENTVQWARAGREEYGRISGRTGKKPHLFAVIQGGNDPTLRKECAEKLLETGFDGYGFGGWPVTDDGRLVDMVALVAELIPPGYPKWALGIGKPEHLVRCAESGYGLFDCTLPTRDARHGRLYVWREAPENASLKGKDFYEYIYPRDRKHVRAAGPVDSHCDCLCCAGYSRAYLHHLFRVKDTLAFRLATIHNLRFYSRLMQLIRTRTSQ